MKLSQAKGKTNSAGRNKSYHSLLKRKLLEFEAKKSK
jgi:hypothetical protein